MANLYITKEDGTREPFKTDKIIETLRRIGAKEDTISHVVQKVKAQLTDGMAASDVYAVLRRELHKESSCIAHRYNLRSGLLKLGPAGFKFEKYVASILQSYKYET